MLRQVGYIFIASIICFFINHISAHIPCWLIRKIFLKMSGMKVGKGSEINMNLYVMNPWHIRIGEHTHINQRVFLDGRAGITIGNNVSISHFVTIMTGSHDIQSSNFQGVFKPVSIEDYAFIGVNATILQGVTIGKGAVVCAGAVVTKDVAPFAVVAGVPAKKIGERNKDLNYHCKWFDYFT